jgi:hypothetical protein
MKSFDATFDRYHALLDEVKSGRLSLANENLDIGTPTRAGGYNLADNAYASLLDKLSGKNFAGVTPQLRDDILSYYADLNRPIATKKHPDAWRKTLGELEALKTAAPAVSGVSP